MKPAPPKRVVIATGRSDGAYYRYAQLYRERLAKAGITLEVRETSGSVENIRLLEDPKSGVEIAFVQGGTASAAKTDTLVSLASLYFEPLWVFSRTAPGPTDLRELRGRRLAIGPEGSGTRAVALTLLAANGITDATAQLLPTTGTDAVQALRAGTVDTVLHDRRAELARRQGDAAHAGDRAARLSPRRRLHQALPFLNKLVLPAGALSLQENLPPKESLTAGPGGHAGRRQRLPSGAGGPRPDHRRRHPRPPRSVRGRAAVSRRRTIWNFR